MELLILVALLGLSASALVWYCIRKSSLRPMLIYLLASVPAAVASKMAFWHLLHLFPLIFLLLFVVNVPVKSVRFAPSLHWAIFMLSGMALAWWNILQKTYIPKAVLMEDIYLVEALFVIPITYFSLRCGRIKVMEVVRAISYIGFGVSVFCVLMTIAIVGPFAMVSARMGEAAGFNANLLASFIDLSLPLSLWIALRGNKQDRMEWIWDWGVLLFQFVILLLTGTRGSMQTMAICGGLCFWAFRKNRSLLVGFAICSVIAATYIGPILLQRILHPSFQEMGSNWGRLRLAQSSFRVLKENNYFWGVGFNSFAQIKYTYGFPFWFDRGNGYSSHNAHLEIYLGWGLLGLVGWMGLWIGQLIKHVRMFWESRKFDRNAAIGVSVFCFFLHGFVESEIAFQPFSWTLFMLLGVSIYTTEKQPRPEV